jgi:response regulator RpfG family c-di-GMP phosphodiesterase
VSEPAFLAALAALDDRLLAASTLRGRLAQASAWLAEVVDGVDEACALALPVSSTPTPAKVAFPAEVPLEVRSHTPAGWHGAFYAPLNSPEHGRIGALLLRGDERSLRASQLEITLVAARLQDLLRVELAATERGTAELVRVNRELQESLASQEYLNDALLENALTLQRTQHASIKALARLAEYRDNDTGGHLQRICEFTRILAREVVANQLDTDRHVDNDYLQDIYLSAMLHDIGKVAVPDRILLKPGRFEPEEMELMKLHTTWGWEILQRADEEMGEQSFLTLAASIARYHHERYDGSGYPEQLAGETIPLSSRIVSIADVYDALTARRPYKEPWSHERAAQEIVSQASSHHDPQLVELFAGVEAEYANVGKRLHE